MITSEKQYKEAVKKLEVLGVSLLSPVKEGVPEVIEKAGRAQVLELIENIKEEIREFDDYKKMDISNLEIHSLDDLMRLPIRYRLASGMSIDNFARLVGISPRQINRYEKESYQNTHTRTLNKILEKLHVDIEGKIHANKNDKTFKKQNHYPASNH